jgi:hypothetical protein
MSKDGNLILSSTSYLNAEMIKAHYGVASSLVADIVLGIVGAFMSAGRIR